MGRRGIDKAEVLASLQGDAVVNFITSLGFAPVRKGREYWFPCPFHDDSDPSFAINPNKAQERGGIFNCFPCGWKGDVFEFVQQTQGLEDFKSTINFMAKRLGLGEGGEVKRSSAPLEVRASKAAAGPAILTSEQVEEDWQRCLHAAIDHVQPCIDMGVNPDALPMIDGCVSAVYPTPVIVVPMRDEMGALTSLRFRSLGPKKPKLDGEGKPKLGPDGQPKLRTVRWSLNRKQNGVATHESRSGLMAPFFQYEEMPSPEQTSFVLEGETDLMAGVSMMLDAFGKPPWPARWWGLPGVGSCHSMLIPDIIGRSAVLFFDPDGAGRSAVFDHRAQYKEKLTGDMKPDLDRPPSIGLMTTLRAAGIHTVAGFPPCSPGAPKVDLRDLYRDRWDWTRLEDHVMRTSVGARQ